MKTKFAFLLAASLLGVTSCTEDEALESEMQSVGFPASRAMVEEVDTFTTYATYKGREYSSVAIARNDSLFYMDEEFNRLMETIAAVPGAVSFVQNDSCVVYFDSQEEFLTAYGIRELDGTEKEKLQRVSRLNDFLPASRGMIANYQNAYNQMESDDLIYAALFDDTNYSDTHLYLHIKNPDIIIEYPHMKDVGLNDKVSSLMVRYNMDDPDCCALLTVWEDSDYNKGDNDRTKHRTNFVATHSSRTKAVYNLKKVSCFNAHDSWNDRISSISFHVGYTDSLPKEY